MFAKVKKIIKPIQKQDFYLPNGEKVRPDYKLPWFGFWQFKNLSIRALKVLVEDSRLILQRRIEFKAELHRRFRQGNKVRSKTWHLASILERDVADQQKCETFWQKIEKKLSSFELSEDEIKKIREKIEADVPRPRV